MADMIRHKVYELLMSILTCLKNDPSYEFIVGEVILKINIV
jgi:hypothetical protein